jgi:signal transduction histidine kinase
VNVVVFALTAGAMIALFWHRKSVLDLWLLVAMSSWLGQSLLNALLNSRFSLGAYFFFVLSFMSNLIVMVALITDSNRLYGRLALSTAARQRERADRLMSMDVMTAAISHEVGQPLAAIGLNASAAVGWLTAAQPDVKKALTALRDVADAKQRTFEIIKSVRATFAKARGRASEFSLNELVLETASLLDKELTASKISLELSLDEALPPILADRVQLQRVLVNLLINAIESLRATRGRSRRIAICSEQIDGKDVLLQVSDSGAGIHSDNMERLFDAFFTTKKTGTGLGLPLCRSIVEDHGGRLWATQGEPHGAKFHLRLPRSGTYAVSRWESEHEALSNLESSLSSLRQTNPGLTDTITELQHVVDEVRASLTSMKS